MNCLSFALRVWQSDNSYKLYYNSDHVINAKSLITGDNYLPIEEFGYEHILKSFNGLLVYHDLYLLKKYFNKPLNLNYYEILLFN